MNNILLKRQGGGGAWIYDSATKEYSLTIDGNVVAIVDANGNMKITGRFLKK